MKLTKDYLKKVIKEELEEMNVGPQRFQKLSDALETFKTSRKDTATYEVLNLSARGQYSPITFSKEGEKIFMSFVDSTSGPVKYPA